MHELHCSFKLAEDFSNEFSQRESHEYLLFASLIEEEVIRRLDLFVNYKAYIPHGYLLVALY